MGKIKFDFEATKERIYAPNSNVPIGAPVDRNGNIANDSNAYGIVLCKETKNEKYWVRYNLVIMVAGYCDIIDAQAIWGDEYSAEAMAAMSGITFCDNHELPTGGGGGGMMVVHGHYDENNPDTLTLDKTFDEMLNNVPNVCIIANDADTIIPLVHATDEILSFKATLGFVGGGGVSDGYEVYDVSVGRDGGVVYSYSEKWFD